MAKHVITFLTEWNSSYKKNFDMRRMKGKSKNSASQKKLGIWEKLVKQCWKSLRSSTTSNGVEENNNGMKISEEEAPREIPLLERLIKTHPIWYLPNISRAGTIHLLQHRDVGSFIVRKSSQQATMALSVRLPEGCGQHIEHFLIQTTDQGLQLEGSNYFFPAIPVLVEYYCNTLDELPCKLVLPKVLSAATTHQELASLALLGQDFWSSSLHWTKSATSSSSGSSGNSGNRGQIPHRSSPVDIVKKVDSPVHLEPNLKKGETGVSELVPRQPCRMVQRSSSSGSKKKTPKLIRSSQKQNSKVSKRVSGFTFESFSPTGSAGSVKSLQQSSLQQPKPCFISTASIQLSSDGTLPGQNVVTTTGPSFSATTTTQSSSTQEQQSQPSISSDAKQSLLTASTVTTTTTTSTTVTYAVPQKAKVCTKTVSQYQSQVASESVNKNLVHAPVAYKSTGIEQVRTPDTPYYRSNLSDRLSDYEDLWTPESPARKRDKSLKSKLQSNKIKGAITTTSASSQSQSAVHQSQNIVSQSHNSQDHIPHSRPVSNVGFVNPSFRNLTTQQKAQNTVTVNSTFSAVTSQVTTAVTSLLQSKESYRSEITIGVNKKTSEPVVFTFDVNQQQKLRPPPVFVPPPPPPVSTITVHGSSNTNSSSQQSASKVRIQFRKTSTGLKTESAQAVYNPSPIYAEPFDSLMANLHTAVEELKTVSNTQSAQVNEETQTSLSLEYGQQEENLALMNAVAEEEEERESIASFEDDDAVFSTKPEPQDGTEDMHVQWTYPRASSLAKSSRSHTQSPAVRSQCQTPSAISIDSVSKKDHMMEKQLLQQQCERGEGGVGISEGRRSVTSDDFVFIDEDDMNGTMESTHTDHPFPLDITSQSSSLSDITTVEDIIAPDLKVRPIGELTLENLKRMSTYDNVTFDDIKNCGRTESTYSGTIFSKPWDSSLWDDLLNLGWTAHEAKYSLPPGSPPHLDKNGVSEVQSSQYNETSTYDNAFSSDGEHDHSHWDTIDQQLLDQEVLCGRMETESVYSWRRMTLPNGGAADSPTNHIFLKPISLQTVNQPHRQVLERQLSNKSSAPGSPEPTSPNLKRQLSNRSQHNQAQQLAQLSQSQPGTSRKPQSFRSKLSSGPTSLSQPGSPTTQLPGTQSPRKPLTLIDGKLVDENGVTMATDEQEDHICSDEDEEEEDVLQIEPRMQSHSISSSFGERLGPFLSAKRVTSMRQNNRDPGLKIRDYIYRLSMDHCTTFGSTIENFLQCTRESNETNPNVVLRNVRQFMSGIKNYLVKHGEGNLDDIIEKERKKLGPEEFLNIDAIIEGALNRCIVRPLKQHIYKLFVNEYTRNGSIRLLSDNIKYASTKTSQELGVRPELQPPQGTSMDVIKHFLQKMQKAHSPLKKLENLLNATSSIYNSVRTATGSGGRSGHQVALAADDFLPMFIYVLVQCGMVSAEIEADYMWGLLHHSLLAGEGGYYLTTLSSAVHVLKNLKEVQEMPVGSWGSDSSNIADFQGFLRVVIPDENNGSIMSKIMPVRPNMSTKEVRCMIAHKFKVTNPQDYGLYLLCDGQEIHLGDSACPQNIKAELVAEEKKGSFAYKRNGAKIAWPTSLMNHQ